MHEIKYIIHFVYLDLVVYIYIYIIRIIYVRYNFR